MSGKIKTLQFTEGVETVKPTTLTNFSSDLVVESISAGQQAEVGKLYLVDTTGGSVALTLPASPIDNDRLAIKLTNGNNNVTFAGEVIKRPGEVMQFQYGNSSWLIVSAYNSDLAKTSTIGQVLTADDLEGGASFQDLPNDLPAAGTAAQALRKVDGTDYNVAWSDVEEVPAGGTTGQALRKNSATDYDASFADVNEVPAGGAINQVLTKASGTDYDLTWADASGGGSGSGEINYIDNPDAELSTAGYVAYADAAQSTPEDGTAGSPTVAINRTTVVGEVLRGSASFELAKDAADRQGEGVSFDFSIDPADENKLLKVYFDYKTSTNYATGDVAVYIYDVTNTTLITPNNTDIVKADDDGAFFECSWLSTTSNSYRLILHVASTSTSAYDLFFDNVIVGPGRTQSGAVISSWQSFTPTAPTNFALSSAAGLWRRVGEMLEARMTFISSGAATGNILLDAADYLGVLGLSYDDSNTASGTLVEPSASWYARDFSASSNYLGDAYVNQSDGSVYCFNNTSNGVLGSTTPFTWAVSDRLTIYVSVPIAEWSGSGVLNVLNDSVIYANARLKVAGLTTTAIAAGTHHIDFKTVDTDIQNGITYSTNTATVQADGVYEIEAQVALSAVNSLAVSMTVLVNGSAAIINNYSASEAQNLVVKGTVALSSGDTIKVQKTGTNAQTGIDDTTRTFLIIRRLADFSANQPVGFGLATADNAGLLTYYKNTTVELDNEFTGGTRTCTVERIGNTVTITGQGVATHSANSTPESSAGLIPDWARPDADVENVHSIETGRVNSTVVEADGTISGRYKTWTGTDSNAGSTGKPLSISYTVS